MYSEKLFVTGTDTDTGKTVLSLLLMQYYIRKGLSPLYVKPFQTGCTDPSDSFSDAAFIDRFLGREEKGPARTAVINCYRNPKAPFFAARDEKKEINPKAALKELNALCLKRKPAIIEGAGGLMVPITGNMMIIDLIPELKAKTILAAGAGLGTINHILLSMEALKNRGIDEPLIFLIEGPENRPSKEMLAENMEAVEIFSGIKPAGVIPPVHDFALPPPEIFSVFEKSGL